MKQDQENMADTNYLKPFKRVTKAVCYFSLLAIGTTIIISAAIKPVESQEQEPTTSSLQPLFDAPLINAIDNPDETMGLNSTGDVNVPFNHRSGTPLNPDPDLSGIPTTVSLPPMHDSSASQAQSIQTMETNGSSHLPAQARMLSPNLGSGDANASTAEWNVEVNDPIMRANSPASTWPARSTATVGRIYQLNHTTWQSFEQRLLNTWNQRLKVATSVDGRHARVLLPNKTNSDYLPILIDRAKNLLTFEGTNSQTAAWKSLVRNLDNAPGDGRVVMIDMQDAEPSQIMQAAYMMGFQEEAPQDPPPQDPPTQDDPKQDEPKQGDDIEQRVVPFNANQVNPPRPTILTQEDQVGVQAPVRIEVVPELGVIILTGHPQDVAKVEKMINDIVATSGLTEATQTQILLENAQASQVAERLQELYDDNYADLKGRASIAPWDSPNSLIVIGQADSVRVIEDLVKLVDVKTDEEAKAEFKTYRLKYISAVDAKARVDLFLGQSNVQVVTENQPPALPAISVADYRSNTLIVRANKALQDQVELLIEELDVEEVDTGAVNVVRVIPLRNAVATDLQRVIQDAINGQLQNAGQGLNTDPQGQQGQFQQQQFDAQGNSSSLRSAQLQFEGPNGEIVKGSIMFDVRVTADTNSNSLVVTGPEAAMPVVEALIKRLDTIPDSESQIKVFPIVHGDAASLLEMLNTLFTGTAQGGQQGQNTALSQLPLQSATAGDGITLTNLRFSLDERVNAIIASGSASDLIVVDSLITRLDVENLDGRLTKVYRLSNLQAQDMADAINAWLDERQAIIEDDPTYVSPLAQVRRQVTVTPVAVGNSLIVSAVPEYYDEIAAIITELDRRPPMVKVKVLLAEIDLTTQEEFGITIGVQDSLLFDRGAAEGILFDFNQQGIGNGNVGRGSLAGQVLSNLPVGRTNSTLGYGGLVVSAGNDSVSFLLRALENKGCLRILSKPHMMTLENLQGRIFSGNSVPRITGSVTNNFNGGVSNTVVDEEVGLILGITPRVSPDGTIVMFVDAQKSAINTQQQGIAISVTATGEVIRSPQIIRRQVQTTIQARHGQTVVISGLVQENKAHVKRGTPILSDLPVIGPLFTFEEDRAERNELLIILTPYLVDNDQEVVMQNQDEMDRIHWCLCDVAEIYGNTEYNGSPISSPSAPVVYYPDSDPAGLQPQVEDSANVTPGQAQMEATPTQPVHEADASNR